MGYWLGIDLGSTVTAAAVRRAAGRAEVVSLGSGSAVVPSVVFVGAEGQVEVGEAALRRAVTDPDRVVRSFIGRIGDQIPMVIGGQVYTAAQLAAMLTRWVVDEVARRQGDPAEGIVVTHPPTWGDYKREVLATSLADAGLGHVRFCAEPQAAAAGYAAGQPFASGRTIAVYDLGGTTFHATVIRTSGDGGFTVLGQPQVLEQLGGADFDDAVFGHVLAAVPGLAELDTEDPATLAAIAALRRGCTRATQALSTDTEVTIPVAAPGIQTQVRLHRAEFDDMIRARLSGTLQVLRRALHTADVQPHQLEAVLLAGGSCRIPLVAQLISTDLDRPITIDSDPSTVIARGAAALAVPAPQVEDIAEAHPVPANPVSANPLSANHAFEEPSEPARPPERPSLTAIPLDVESVQSRRRRATSRSMKRAALAGSLALLAAAASVPLFIAHSDSTPQAVAGTQAPRTPSTTANAGKSNDQPLAAASSIGPTLAVPVAAPSHSASDTAGAVIHPAHTAGLQTAAAGTAVPVSNSARGGATSPGGGGTPSPDGGGTTSTGGSGGGATSPGGGGPTSPGGGGTTSTGDGGGTTSTPPDPAGQAAT
ncbi:MAG TPA: Hsp70 family protein [Pseudonocardiaceae bacterium]|nr:Hsp70 family protein [Pseudonocardiaceae bacterium]